MHYVLYSLLLILPLVLSSSQAEVDIDVSIRHTPARLDKPVHVSVAIRNNHIREPIPSGSFIIFSSNNFTKRSVCSIKEIKAGTHRTVKHSLDVYSGISYRDVPSDVHFVLIGPDNNNISTSRNTFSFKSGEVSGSLTQWTPRQLTTYTSRWWLPRWMDFFGTDLINVCFFGIVGSGKSTTLNTLLTSLLFDDNLEMMRPVGGGGKHVTTKVEGIDLTQSERRSPLKMRFWDTFGVTNENWPELKFREFLNGRLKSYSIFDLSPLEPILNLSSPHEVPIQDRIHVVLLFVPAESFKNELLFNRMITQFRIAVSEGYNPILMITFSSELTADEKNMLMETIQANFHVPKYQVIFVPYYGDEPQRDFLIDRESLFIINRIQASADAFLESCPRPSLAHRLQLTLTPLLCLSVILYLIRLVLKAVNSRSSSSKSQSSPSSLVSEPSSSTPESSVSEPPSSSEPAVSSSTSIFTNTSSTSGFTHTSSTSNDQTDITIRYQDGSMQIRVRSSTPLSSLIPHVSRTFNLEERNILFVDKNGVQFLDDEIAINCGDIFVHSLTSP